jgi:transcriptional regulator with PAS, ATPase and Fis domain
MCDLRTRVERVAGTSFTALIEGESGVGKELVARAIHAQSSRRAGPFVPLNCAALVETLVEAELFGIEDRTATGVRGRRGKVEQADRGTLFLDEVGDLSSTAQAKLLRVLQDMMVERVGGHTARHVDARVVAATNRSLRALVEAGKFRSDLYYRLAGVEIVVPPLRARLEDIPALVEHFAARHLRARRLTVAAATFDALNAYDWPGNVRQLGRVLERAIALAQTDVISPRDLPDEITHHGSDLIREAASHGDTLRAWSSRYARTILNRCQGNKRRACEVLDISYHTLQTLVEYQAAPVPATAARVVNG